MMRFYRGFMERVLVALTFNHYYEGNSLQAMAQRAMRLDLGDSGKNYTLQNAVARVLQPGPDKEDNSTEVMCEDLLKRLAAERNKSSSEGDLLDTLAAILQMPYPRNHFGPKTLQQLKTALLRPDELTGVNKVKLQELACAGCAHVFQSGEMVTIQVEPGQQAILQCRNCQHPESVVCTHCLNTAPLGKKVFSVLNKAVFDCGEHQEGQVEPPLIPMQVANRGPEVVMTTTGGTPAMAGTAVGTAGISFGAFGRSVIDSLAMPAPPNPTPLTSSLSRARDRYVQQRRGELLRELEHNTPSRAFQNVTQPPLPTRMEMPTSTITFNSSFAPTEEEDPIRFFDGEGDAEGDDE